MSLEYVSVFGIRHDKFGTIHPLNEDGTEVVYFSGNFVVFEDFNNSSQHIISGSGTGGIGAIALSDDKQYLAIGENGNQPVIRVLEISTKKIIKTLKGGADKGFSAIDFGPNNGLASVASLPDCKLTIWDLKEMNDESEGEIVLRNAASAQEVVKVAFLEDKSVITCGTGHVKFWAMAKTFTGLKLKGRSGKFGEIELSDIVAFVKLSDGRVLTGTEHGTLILWDGEFVEHVFSSGPSPLHRGLITGIMITEEDAFGKCIVTIGEDGKVNWIKYDDVISIDNNDKKKVELQPVCSFDFNQHRCLNTSADGVSLVSMERIKRGYFFVNSKGMVYTFNSRILSQLSSLSMDKLAETCVASSNHLTKFHSGGIVDLTTSYSYNIGLSIGGDGSIFSHSLTSNAKLDFLRFDGSVDKGVFIHALNKISDDLDADKIAIAGFESGVVRFIKYSPLTCLNGYRAHQSKVTAFVHVFLADHYMDPVVSKDGCSCESIIISFGEDNTMFIMGIHISDTFEVHPVGFVELGGLIVKQAELYKVSRNFPIDTKYQGELCLLLLNSEGSLGLVSINMLLKVNKEETTYKVTWENSWEDIFEVLKFDFPKHIISEQIEVVTEKEEEEDPTNAMFESVDYFDEEEKVFEWIEKTADQYLPETLITSFCLVKNESGALDLFVTGSGSLTGTIVKYEIGYDIALDIWRPYQVIVGGGDVMPVRSTVMVNQLYNVKNLLLVGMEDGSFVIEDVTKPPAMHEWVRNNPLHYIGDLPVKLCVSGEFLLGISGDCLIKYKNLFESSSDLQSLDGLILKPTDKEISMNDRTIEAELQHMLLTDHQYFLNQKKSQFRDKINVLRQEYFNLRDYNSKLDENQQIDKNHFFIDKYLIDQLRSKFKRNLNAIKDLEAFPTEKSRLLLEKIDNYLVGNLQEIPFGISGIVDEYLEVSSFKIEKLPEQLKKDLESIKRELRYEQYKQDIKHEVDIVEKIKLEEGLKSGSIKQRRSSSLSKIGRRLSLVGMSQTTQSALQKHEKLEQRRIRRDKRKEDWNHLYRKKPKANTDEEFIEYDLLNQLLQDQKVFTLKIKPSVILAHVPKTFLDEKGKYQENLSTKNLNLNTIKNEIIIIFSNLNKIMNDFNIRLNKLRMKKLSILKLTHKCYTRILKFSQNKYVAKSFEPVPKMKPFELFEVFFEISEDDLENFESLQKLETAFKLKKEREAQASGFGGLKKVKGQEGDELDEDELRINKLKAELFEPRFEHFLTRFIGAPRKYDNIAPAREFESNLLTTSASVTMLKSNSIIDIRRQENISQLVKTPLQTFINNSIENNVDSYIKELENHLTKIQKSFDEELQLVKVEKFKIQKLVTTINMFYLLKLQEFSLLQNYDQKGQILEEKLKSKHKLKKQCEKDLVKYDQLIKIEEQHIKKNDEDINRVNEEFKTIVSEKNQYFGILQKIFLKTYKNVMDDQFDNFEDTFDFDFDEDDFVEDMCPEGCSEELYESVIEARSKRFAHEEQRNKSIQRKENNEQLSLKTKKRMDVLGTELSEIKREIIAFEHEKLAQLNLIPSWTYVSLNKIYTNSYINDVGKLLVEEKKDLSFGLRNTQAKRNTRMNSSSDEDSEVDELHNTPQDYTQKIYNIFNNETYNLFEYLKGNLDSVESVELVDEPLKLLVAYKTDLTNLLKRREEHLERSKVYGSEGEQLKQEKYKLKADISEKKKEKEEAQKKCEELQMLQFGRLIDLETLEKAASNSEVAELETRLMFADNRRRKEIEEWKEKLGDKKQGLSDIVSENTELLKEYKSLNEQKNALEEYLEDENKRAVNKKHEKNQAAMTEEYQKLKRFTRRQKAEIDGLRAEIHLLSSKGGFIYTQGPMEEMASTVGTPGNGFVQEELNPRPNLDTTSNI
eukprot:TRINITY_DN202_c0_g1_i1.p1 TRINITY_DN202_c0_g1~~TRINITY_DN202_c0_g1_i1.p1  ORF type:complete len:1895 (+),score=478.61 TRINITY_DN202_c0_g1_i1:36-5687(+)